MKIPNPRGHAGLCCERRCLPRSAHPRAETCRGILRVQGILRAGDSTFPAPKGKSQGWGSETALGRFPASPRSPRGRGDVTGPCPGKGLFGGLRSI